MKFTQIPIPAKRVRCIVCDQKLTIEGGTNQLTVCVTNGSIVLTCPDHANIGDDMVQIVRLQALKQIE